MTSPLPSDRTNDDVRDMGSERRLKPLQATILKNNSAPILPGATIGVLGGGQLGRMFALSARSMGFRIHIYSPEHDAPAGQVADKEVVAGYLDLDRLREFARETSVVTFEFENVPSEATRVAAEETLVRPGGHILHTTQHRLREKTFLKNHGFPVTPFQAVRSLAELSHAAGVLGFPAVLKTAGFGYDGKGQVKVQGEQDLEPAWKKLGGVESIYESFVRFSKELSVVAARGAGGEFKAFPVFENEHANHILDVTISPAPVAPEIARQAEELARGILEALEVEGLLTVELFLTGRGELLVNELAPRPHNSGHLTIDACVTSQFEQQLRAICRLPLGSTGLRGPAAMANLLGDLWKRGTPNWERALRDDGVKLHLYGKTEPRPGRKMGHLTALADSPIEAARRVREARSRLVET